MGKNDQQLLSELARVKAIFQLHALSAAIGVPVDMTPNGIPRDQGTCPKCGSDDWYDWPQGAGNENRIKCHDCGTTRNCLPAA